jgi:hypothetical protein
MGIPLRIASFDGLNVSLTIIDARQVYKALDMMVLTQRTSRAG